MHTSTVGLHLFGLIEYHLGVVLDLTFTSTDGNHGAVGIFLETYDVGDVFLRLASCVVAHTDGDVVVAILVNTLCHYEALQAWMIGVERLGFLLVGSILSLFLSRPTVVAVTTGSPACQEAGIGLFLYAQHVVILDEHGGVHACTYFIRQGDTLLS